MAEYTAGNGNSSEADRVYFKKLRGEELTNEEWKVYRENFDDRKGAKELLNDPWYGKEAPF